MRKILATTLLIMAGSSCAMAQEKTLMRLTEMPQQVTVQTEQPLVLVNGQEATMPTLILSPEKIAEVNVFKKNTPEATKMGKKGENGLVQLSLKEGVALVKYPQILDHFNIPTSERGLKVSINGTKLVEPDLILADLSEIAKVEVTEAGPREFAQWGWNQGDKFLNIVTKEKK